MLTTLAAVAALSTGLVSTDAITNSSRMDEVAAHYRQSTLVEPQASVGWYSGRCYLADDPGAAVGNILAIETRTQSGHGPIFGSATKAILMGKGYAGRGATPDEFDNLTPEQAVPFDNLINSIFQDDSCSNVFVHENALNSDNAAGNLRYQVRQKDGYLFVREVRITDGRDYGYCYFFKKVR